MESIMKNLANVVHIFRKCLFDIVHIFISIIAFKVCFDRLEEVKYDNG